MKKKYTFTRVLRLQSLIEYILKSWRKELLIAVIAMAVVVLYGVIKVGMEVRESKQQPNKVEKKIELSEQQYMRIKTVYEYQRLMLEKQKYNNESIAMKIDSNKKEGYLQSYYFGNVSPEVISNVHDQYLLRIDQAELHALIVEKTGENINGSYYGEVLSLEDIYSVGGIFFRIYHYDSEILEQVCVVIDEYMEVKRQEIGQDGFAHDFIKTSTKLEETDSYLIAFQKENIDSFITIQDQYSLRYEDLNSKERNYLELYTKAKETPEYEEGQPLYMEVDTEKNATQFRIEMVYKYAKIGLLFGVLLGVLYGFVTYLYSPYLLDENFMEDIFGIPLLARIDKNAGTEEIEMTATVILGLLECYLGNASKILILGKSSTEDKDPIFLTMKKLLGQRGKELYFRSICDEEVEIIDSVNQTDFVVLLEEKAVSNLVEIAKKIDICKLCNKKTVGSLVLK